LKAKKYIFDSPSVPTDIEGENPSLPLKKNEAKERGYRAWMEDEFERWMT
jgi:hypothetical protein